GTLNFRPKIAVLLNIFNAHLDYHGTKEAYGAAKANIFKNQTEKDYAVVNADDSFVMKLVRNTDAQIIPFSVHQILKDGAYIQDDHLFFKSERILPISEIVLPGQHNLENILAAIATVKILGVSNEAITHVLKTFTGV